MSIERPDWSDAAPVSSVPGLVPLDPAVPADIRAEYERAASTTPAAADQAVVTSDAPRGIGHALQREMALSMGGFDGFEQNVALAHQNAIAVEEAFASLGIEPATLNAELNALPTPLLDKVRRTIWKNPGIQPLDLLEKLERTLTLDEAHVAEQALRRLARGAAR
jgi:hypothetical protein